MSAVERGGGMSVNLMRMSLNERSSVVKFSTSAGLKGESGNKLNSVTFSASVNSVSSCTRSDSTPADHALGSPRTVLVNSARVLARTHCPGMITGKSIDPPLPEPATPAVQADVFPHVEPSELV